MKIIPAVPQEDLTPSGKDNRSDVARGMVLMVLAMLTLPMMDGMSKVLSTWYGVSAGQMTFGRFLVQAMLLAPVIIFVLGVRGLIPSQLFVNLLRGALMGVAVMLFNVTLRYMPIADALAVFFLEPFILTILSVVILGEKVGWRRGVAVVAGFIGAMFIVQPSYEVFGPISLLPICTAVLFAFYLILTRKMAAEDNPMTMQFASGVGGMVTLGLIVTVATHFEWENLASPQLPEFGMRWLLIFVMGVFATVGHLVVVLAFRLASASILAPFQYMEIVTGTILGFWLFGDFPDAFKWFGIAIIIASGIYLFMRERKVAEED